MKTVADMLEAAEDEESATASVVGMGMVAATR